MTTTAPTTGCALRSFSGTLFRASSIASRCKFAIVGFVGGFAFFVLRDFAPLMAQLELEAVASEKGGNVSLVDLLLEVER
jgi:hypothetical protein